VEAVKGLERFRTHFEEYAGRYVQIGGVASLLVSEEQGLDFRAIRDLDIVLCVEALDDSFMQALWDFIRQSGYAQKDVAYSRQASQAATLHSVSPPSAERNDT
jgi:hypothetical protein